MRRSIFMSVFMLLFILIAIPMLMMVACGDDDDDEPTPTPTHTPTPIPPTPTPTATPAPDILFFDNFDSYETGSTIAGQGGWEAWGGGAAADATVVDEQAYSEPNSLAVREGSDVVQTFSGVSSGMWYAKAMTYVPSDQTGDFFFIMLNQYGDTNNWSLQVVMSNDTGLVQSLGGTGFAGTGELALITDQWVEIRAEIDLDGNQVTIFYNNETLDQTVWQASGVNEIGAFDLFSDGSSNSYYDDVYLDDSM